MNIFVTDECPKRSALALDNRRLNKMMLETLQLFGYAMNNLGIDVSFFPEKKDGTPFKSTGSHTKHPCTIWLQQAAGNFTWLHQHLLAMCDEYEYRYGKPCSYRENARKVARALGLWPAGELTPFVNCSLHKIDGDTILSYRLTMIDKWEKAKAENDPRKSVSFGSRGEPEWYSFLKEQGTWRS